MKAVIVDFRDGHAAALRDDGCVVKIRDVGYKLGQVIELHERVQPRWRRTVFSLAAAAALLLSIGGAAYATPYGTVTLDADSSIQYTINMFDYVLDVHAENEEGEALLAELDIRQFRHRPVDSAITSAMQQLEQRRAPEDAVLSVSVSANTRNEKHTERLSRELERTVNEHMPIPSPESENQPGMHNSAAEPTRPEDPAADSAAFRPDDKQVPWTGLGIQVLEAHHWNHRPDSSRMGTEHLWQIHRRKEIRPSCRENKIMIRVSPIGGRNRTPCNLETEPQVCRSRRTVFTKKIHLFLTNRHRNTASAVNSLPK